MLIDRELDEKLSSYQGNISDYANFDTPAADCDSVCSRYSNSSFYNYQMKKEQVKKTLKNNRPDVESPNKVIKDQ